MCLYKQRANITGFEMCVTGTKGNNTQTLQILVTSCKDYQGIPQWKHYVVLSTEKTCGERRKTKQLLRCKSKYRVLRNKIKRKKNSEK